MGDVNAYVRQYLAILVAGQQVIYVNALTADSVSRHAEVHPLPWRDDLIEVCDGGPMAWGVVFYPVAGVFRDFELNGSGPEW